LVAGRARTPTEVGRSCRTRRATRVARSLARCLG
jgi:hypothetical protein